MDSYATFSPDTLNMLGDEEPRLRANSWPFKRPPDFARDSDVLEILSPISATSGFNCIPEIMEATNFTMDPILSLPSSEKTIRPKSQKKPWGEKSYAAIITDAIESSPEQKMTLQDIYDYFIANYEYFAKLTDCNSSGGWKNSIRHNLSLHSKFQRLENCESGKSAFWIVCAGSGAQKQGYTRRRATFGCAQRDMRKTVRRAKSRISICGQDLKSRSIEHSNNSEHDAVTLFHESSSYQVDTFCSTKSLTGLASRFSDMGVEELGAVQVQANSPCSSTLLSLPFQVDPRELVLGPHKDLPGDQILVNLVVDAVVRQQLSESNNNFLAYTPLTQKLSEDNCASAIATPCCSELQALLF